MKVDPCGLYLGDCLDVMKGIPDGSVGMVLCDLPYGVLNKGNAEARWDIPIPMDLLWAELGRVKAVMQQPKLF